MVLTKSILRPVDHVVQWIQSVRAASDGANLRVSRPLQQRYLPPPPAARAPRKQFVTQDAVTALAGRPLTWCRIVAALAGLALIPTVWAGVARALDVVGPAAGTHPPLRPLQQAPAGC